MEIFFKANGWTQKRYLEFRSLDATGQEKDVPLMTQNPAVGFDIKGLGVAASRKCMNLLRDTMIW